MKQKSKFKTIYKILKTNPNDGGVYLAKIIDLAISNRIKPLDVDCKALEDELAIKSPDKSAIAIKTVIIRFMDIVRGNGKVTELFDNCKRLTAKKFVINMLMLYYNEVEQGVITDKRRK